MLAPAPVPGYLAVADVIVAVYLFLAFEDDGVHGIEKIEHLLHSRGAGEGYNVVGTAIHAFFRGLVDASRQAADGGKHVFTGAAELGIVVAKGHGEGNAAV